jgi:hypothetical protein
VKELGEIDTSKTAPCCPYGELAELAGEFEAAGKIQRWRLAPHHENGATPK